jgi:hypothetical protein
MKKRSETNAMKCRRNTLIIDIKLLNIKLLKLNIKKQKFRMDKFLDAFGLPKLNKENNHLKVSIRSNDIKAVILSQQKLKN